MPSSDLRPVISYRPADVKPEPIGIRRDGDDWVIVLGPVNPVRLMVAQLIPIGLLVIVLVFLGFCWFMVKPSAAEERFLLGLPIVGLGILLAALLIRFVPVARFGRVPAVFRASRTRLQLHAPMLGRRGRKIWPAAELVDVSVRHAGAFPVLLRFIRLQIASTDDRIDVLLIPSPGGESLLILENALRDTLILPLPAQYRAARR